VHKSYLVTDLASRNLDLSTRTASHVLCFSCSSIAVNLRWTMFTIRSISFGATGRVRLCSRSRFTTCVVNSLQACSRQREDRHCGQLTLYQRKGNILHCTRISYAVYTQ